MNQRTILIVEDTESLAEMYASALAQAGYQVTAAHSASDLFHILETDSFAPDLLILDVKLPDMDGMEILSRLRARHFNAPVIIMTGHGSVHMAVDAMRLGATDFLVKPFPIEKMCESAERALAAPGLQTKAALPEPEEGFYDRPPRKDQKVRRTGFGGFIGTSPPMQLVYDIIEGAARSNASVFITGESGTGKEICAEAIHKYSKRGREPFIAINCAAIPRELLESELFGHVKGAFTGAHSDREGAVAQAHGGTLFLDEIAEMAPDMQTKLLRFLQNLSFRKVGGSKDHQANVRIICATNRSPAEEIRDGRLRQDLFYRLHVIPIHMPPLRDRRSDIIDLADYFLKLYSREEGKSFLCFSEEAEHILLKSPWPGNVRQLQNIVRGVVVLYDGRTASAAMVSSVLKSNPEVLPSSLSPPVPLDETADVRPLWIIERSAIEHAIALCDGNIPRAAAMLEISPSTIYRKKMIWEQAPTG
jgi:two-component system repressor protein LuxO